MHRITIACLGGIALAWAAAAYGADDTAAAGTDRLAQVQSDNGGTTAAPERATATGTGTARLKEVIVEAKKPLSAASSDEIRAADYELRPHGTTQEILNNVPGLVVSQHQGGGKATQYLIRGFDADHGTDFAVSVDGLPVNLVTHAHGQGYADLNFLIPETVERLQLFKGPYFAQLGDFDTAGALNIVTKDAVPENFVRSEGGFFDTQRYVAVGSPKLTTGKVLVATQAYFSDGPFVNPQHYQRYNVFGKYSVEPTAESKLSVTGDVYSGKWNGSGQIPLRFVETGELYRFGSEEPTEGGISDRENLNLRYTYTPSAQEEWAFQVYGSRYTLNLFTDFTFFKDTGLRFYRRPDGSIADVTRGDPQPASPDQFIPGDGLEQDDRRLLYGGRASYTRYWAIADRPVQSQIGIETRNDSIDVSLHRQVQRQRFFTINQVGVEERSVAGFMQHQIFLTDWLRFEGGLRGDVYFFTGRDRVPPNPCVGAPCLGSQATGPDDANFDTVRIHGNTSDGIVSPKASLILTPVTDTDVYLNFGSGFHSNDARNALLAKSNPAEAGGLQSPLTRALGYELGARTRQFDRLDVATALWLLDLDSELVFSGDAGNQETGSGGNFAPSAATRRWGVDFETRYQIVEWLFFDYDLSYADPRFRASGEAIALAPTLLMNGGLTATLDNGFEAALRVRFLDDRPAIEDRSLTARGYTLVDLLAKYRWRNMEASVGVFNLTDTAWREAQFSDTSCTRSEVGSAVCSATPGKQSMHPEDPASDIHFTPGNPLNVRGGITMYF